MKRRVVVTGLGAITPIGNDVESFWNGLKNGTVGIGPVTAFDVTDYKAKLAAEVKDFDPKKYMDIKTARRMERFSQFAVAAAGEALQDAGIDMEKEDPFRVGVSVGSGIGGLDAIEREYKKLLEKGPGRVNPLLVPLMISNMAAGNIGIQYGLKGKNINVVTACATGTHSIGEAFRSIQYGEADVMVAGGAEASITPVGTHERKTQKNRHLTVTVRLSVQFIMTHSQTHPLRPFAGRRWRWCRGPRGRRPSRRRGCPPPLSQSCP